MAAPTSRSSPAPPVRVSGPPPPTASAYAQIPATTVTVTFTDAVTGAVVAFQDNVVLTANQTSSIYLIGSPGAQGIIVTQDN